MEINSNYELLELVHDVAGHSVYRARRTVEHAGLLLLSAGNQDGEERLRRRYELRADLNECGLARTLGHEESFGRRILTTEDPGGMGLGAQAPLSQSEFFPAALSLTRSIAALHDRRIVLRGMHARGILLDRSAGRAVWIEAFAALRLQRRRDGFACVPLSAESLAYAAPESIGRLQQRPDWRADLYSLGAIFFQMLCGRPPFLASDVVELAHQHVAGTPPRLTEIDPLLSPRLAVVVEKLLKKNPEQRYQSAYGLLRDLEVLQQSLGPQPPQSVESIGFEQSPEAFHPGTFDELAIFRAATHLHGRQRELQELELALRQAESGLAALVLVSGPAGAGKSALIDSFRRERAGDRVYFASGKFDPLQSQPLHPLLDALRGLLREVLDPEFEEQATWRLRLGEAFAHRPVGLASRIPELETLLGDGPHEEELDPGARRDQTRLTLSLLIEAFARRDRPLVLCLEDLHFADPDSLSLLKMLLANRSPHHLMVILTTRPASSSLTDLLSHAAPAFRRRSLKIGLLPRESIRDLITESLPVTDAESLERLVDVCAWKTDGNPLLIKQFLATLYEEDILSFDPVTARWKWEPSEIENQSADPGDWLAAQLGQLRSEERLLLQIAACAGRRFRVELLAQSTGHSPVQTERMLQSARRRGLLVRDADGLRFSHDRIHEAAYERMSPSERAQNHYRIARTLLDRSGAASPQAPEILEQFLAGFDLLRRDVALHAQFAELVLHGAKLARNSLAHSSLRRYLQAGVRLLQDGDAHRLPRSMNFALRLGLMEAELLAGDLERGRQLADELSALAENAEERFRVQTLRIEALAYQLDLESALAAGAASPGLQALLSPTRRKLEMGAYLLRFRASRQLQSAETLLSMPELDNPSARRRTELLMKLVPPAYLIDPEIGVFLGLELLRVTLKSGASEHAYSACAMYGVILALVWKDYLRAYEFGRASLELCDRYDRPAAHARNYFGYGLFLSYWGEPLSNSLQYFERG